MSLSKTAPNGSKIATYQVLLDVAVALKSLLDDPKTLQKYAYDAYALSEQEEARAAAAKGILAQIDAASEAAQKEQVILEEKTKEYEKQKAAYEATRDSIKAEQQRLAKVDADYGKRALELDGKEKDLLRRESELAKANVKLKDDNDALNLKRAKIIEDEEAIKAKAEQLRSIVGA